jgi:predicted nuclease with RNAse H fold
VHRGVMNPIYLGVDIAGSKNTWVSALSPNDDGLVMVHGPHTAALEDVVGYCEDNNVVAVAIDAQLTIALSEDSGFRTSDLHLRELLPPDCKNWVASINSLMAVPIRGRLLADCLSPIVGTVLETHPRASLFFGLKHVEQVIFVAIRRYKSKSNDTRAEVEVRERHTQTLWQHWTERFNVGAHRAVRDDGALDSLVCATVAYLFHHAPVRLYKLRHQVPHKTGCGPFYILAPNVKSEALTAAGNPRRVLGGG